MSLRALSEAIAETKRLALFLITSDWYYYLSLRALSEAIAETKQFALFVIANDWYYLSLFVKRRNRRD